METEKSKSQKQLFSKIYELGGAGRRQHTRGSSCRYQNISTWQREVPSLSCQALLSDLAVRHGKGGRPRCRALRAMSETWNKGSSHARNPSKLPCRHVGGDALQAPCPVRIGFNRLQGTATSSTLLFMSKSSSMKSLEGHHVEIYF